MERIEMRSWVTAMERPAQALRQVLLPVMRFVLTGGLLLTAVLSIAFVIFSMLPTDPVRSALGINASEEAVQALRKELGYDQPRSAQYLHYLIRAARFDFGRSLSTGRPITTHLVPAMTETLSYVASALCLSALGSFILITLAHFGGRPIRLMIIWSVRLFTSIPSIVISIVMGVMVVVSSMLRFLPSIEWESFFTAVIALSVYPLCSLTEIGNTEACRTERLSYVLAARAFGLSKIAVYTSYVLRSILVAWLGHLSNLVASLVVGSAVIETVFSLPGLGQLLVRAISVSDYPMLQGIIVVLVVLFIIVNALFDRWLLGSITSRPRG